MGRSEAFGVLFQAFAAKEFGANRFFQL